MPEQLLDFTGRVVLVTGGKSGIGRAAAQAFAKQGARVVIAGRSQADDTLRSIRDAGGEALFVRTDVSIAEQVRHLVDATLEAYGRLDVAFNNSGLLPVTADLVEQSEEDFDKILATDLKGAFLCMKYQILAMLNAGGGAIINCGSVASLIADPGMSPYVAAKHGLAGLSKAAALEYATRNIRINTVCPGFTKTEMTRGWLADPQMCELVKSYNAVNRIASPDEIAGLVLFLASPMASFITGAVIPVDGAQTAH